MDSDDSEMTDEELEHLLMLMAFIRFRLRICPDCRCDLKNTEKSEDSEKSEDEDESEDEENLQYNLEDMENMENSKNLYFLVPFLKFQSQ